jgi:hypothetical protein
MATCWSCWNAAMGHAAWGKAATKWRSVMGSAWPSVLPGGAATSPRRARTWLVRSFHLASQRQAVRNENVSREAAHAACMDSAADRASSSLKSWQVRSEQ